MIVNADDLVQSGLSIVPYRSLLSDEAETVSLQESNELTKSHDRSPEKRQAGMSFTGCSPGGEVR
jgi:hypothetical protein